MTTPAATPGKHVPVAGKKPVPPTVNHKQPDGLHVPSGVQGAAIRDASQAINAHRMPPQTPQTVGTNPQPPATRSSSGQVDTTPLVTPASPYLNPPYSGLISGA